MTVNRGQKKLIGFFFLLWSMEIFFPNFSFGQTKFFNSADTLSKKRVWIASGISAYTQIGSISALYGVWYSQNANSTFHFFNDYGNWGNVDKYGHAYSSYQLSRTSGNLYRWTGMSHRNSAWVGFALGLSYQTTLEIFDGFSTGYGFSWGDVWFNILGSSLYLGQELTFKEQIFIPKFSYHPTSYAALRPNTLGSNHAERLLKDYNGQTYWLSFSPKSFLKSSKFPGWLCISMGYGIDARIVGDKTSYMDANGNTYFSNPEFYVSLDVDFKKLPIKNKTLKKVLTSLNYLKIPAPAISLRGNKFKFYPVYF